MIAIKTVGFLKEKGLRIVCYGVFYIPALIPMITCYVHFGVINRVASVAMENKYILSKAKDYLFDLNLGMLPYEPIILFAFFIRFNKSNHVFFCDLRLRSHNITRQSAGKKDRHQERRDADYGQVSFSFTLHRKYTLSPVHLLVYGSSSRHQLNSNQ